MLGGFVPVGRRGGWMAGCLNEVRDDRWPSDDSGDSGGDREAYSGPVSVSMFQALLVLIEGVGLDIHKGTSW